MRPYPSVSHSHGRLCRLVGVLPGASFGAEERPGQVQGQPGHGWGRRKRGRGEVLSKGARARRRPQGEQRRQGCGD